MSASPASATVALFLEEYLDSVSGLPQEVRRNFALMRKLDEECQEHLHSVKEEQKGVLQRAGEAAMQRLPQDASAVAGVRAKYERMDQLSQEKVAIAVRTYELVDRHIQRLDSDLKRYETELEQKSRDRIKKKEAVAAKRAERRSHTKRNRTAAALAMANPYRPNKKANTPPTSGLAQVLDMPIDPNEPVYCICNRVSFGQMVGCDNATCPKEWFHYECVGLKEEPVGEWLCPLCRPKPAE